MNDNSTYTIKGTVQIYDKDKSGSALQLYLQTDGFEKYIIENDSMMPIARDLSFPSNHVARNTAFIIIIGYWFSFFKNNTWIGKLLWLFPIMIGVSRLYLLQHYFFDIIGGALYGLIISIILCKVFKLNEPFITKKFTQ